MSPMFASLMPLLASSDKPIVSHPLIDWFMGLVNWASVPERSLTFFFMPGFILMLVCYRKWTKPLFAGILLAVFCFAYFGSMLISNDYLSILQKADNVPITIMLLAAAVCLWAAFRQAAINDERIEAGKPLIEEEKEDKVLTWPDLIYSELICLVIASAVLILWAVALPAPLESPANPAGPPNPSKAPWYFLGLQEMLVYFDPWHAGVLLPGLIVVGLIAMPYIDTNPKGNGYYTFKQRPFAITVWLFGFLVLWIVLIVFGTFLRGPNWNFFGPFEFWDSKLQVALTNVNLSDYVWVKWTGQGLPENKFVREMPGIIATVVWLVGVPFALVKAPAFLRKSSGFVGRVFNYTPKMYQQMGFLRFVIMMFLLMNMAMLPVKMGLRWLFHLKYFVYLPEINLNL